MGQNSPDELTSKRNWPVIKVEVAHIVLLFVTQTSNGAGYCQFHHGAL